MSEDPERRLAAIVSADVVGYSRLMGLDEVGTLESLRTHRRELIDPKIAEHGGRIVKTMGDGLLLEFPSVVAAVKCAMAMQNGMVARNADMSDDAAIRFRVGIHLGDVIIDGDDIHGDGVNIAARVQEVAEPDGICVTADVYRQVETRLGVSFASLGDRTLKNIAQPVGLYALRLERDGEQQSQSPDLWLSHLEYDWKSVVWSHLWRALSAQHKLIRYDERGNGLSDARPKQMTFESWVEDLEPWSTRRAWSALISWAYRKGSPFRLPMPSATRKGSRIWSCMAATPKAGEISIDRTLKRARKRS